MRTLLIDAEIICYKAASACEVETDWGDDLWTLHSDLAEAKSQVDLLLQKWIETLKGDRLIFAVTAKDNFRKAILPTYKSNRKGVRKPLCLGELKKYLYECGEVYERPGLEADDCLGVLATMKGDDERIVVSIDKDMKQLPALVFNPDKDTEPQAISENEANYWHMMQCLTGDKTDGYDGCPGIGPVKAEKILTEADGDWWPAVVKAYAKAGLSEEEALRQAQVARICRASDYDFKAKKPIPWSPK